MCNQWNTPTISCTGFLGKVVLFYPLFLYSYPKVYASVHNRKTKLIKYPTYLPQPWYPTEVLHRAGFSVRNFNSRACFVGRQELKIPHSPRQNSHQRPYGPYHCLTKAVLNQSSWLRPPYSGSDMLLSCRTIHMGSTSTTTTFNFPKKKITMEGSASWYHHLLLHHKHQLRHRHMLRILLWAHHLPWNHTPCWENSKHCTYCRKECWRTINTLKTNHKLKQWH